MIRAAVVVLALLGTPTFATPDAKQLGKDRIAAIEKVYLGVFAQMKSGRAVVDSVYLWSMRWLDAEIDTGKTQKLALADHLARMTMLERDVVAAKGTGQASAIDADAAAYFKLEAEYWVARGKR
jgi:hypothetical protein